jgi:hypothetical protein
VAEVSRLAGGVKKGVYRVRLGGEVTVILYRWTDGENYWRSRGDAGWPSSRPIAPRYEDAGGESLERLMERDPADADVVPAELGRRCAACTPTWPATMDR